MYNKKKDFNLKLDYSIHNRFDIEVVDSRTGKLKQRAQAENILLNTIWTRLFNTSTPIDPYFKYIHYGSGTTTPVVTNTSLNSFIGSIATTDPVWVEDIANNVISYRQKIILSEQTSVGSTIAEVGLGYGAESSKLVTHALLQDMNGNTITINKTNTDIITIYATVFIHWATLSDVRLFLRTGDPIIRWLAGTIPGYYILSSDDYGAAMGLTPGYDGGLGGYNLPNTATYYHICNGTRSLSQANKTLTINGTRIGASQGNSSAKGYATMLALSRVGVGGNAGYYKPWLVFKVGDSWYTGTNIIGEAIGTGDGTTVDFATDFSFATNATIYIDGVAVSSGVTVEDIPLLYDQMGAYFEIVSFVNDTGGMIPQSNCYNQGGILGPIIYYNPYYTYGIVSFYCPQSTNSYFYLSLSDDLNTWYPINLTSSAFQTFTMPVEHQHRKYWKFTAGTNGFVNTAIYSPKNLRADSLNGKNIHFSTPPVAGAVITADYTTRTIAKDENHVFDWSITVSVGEHTA